ncbi:FKBP-type peptidyl-prolyl cis-trans isomerase, partial [Serratia marcescens]|uniref:FKBP-type peptidyl-prolyl cis-trans isomerase n=1 Tax=Serratia marcescens TaxID=615 RepID=UPI0011E7288D
DGKVFDNSGNENIPQQVKIDSLLPAVTNVLTQVTAGSEIEIILPPELAFGEEGIENFIPGNATVIFNIKISKVIAN